MIAKMDPSLPASFEKPFLILNVVVPNGVSNQMLIDIDGKIELFFEQNDAVHTIKPALQYLIDLLRAHGHQVNEYGMYTGSAGPSHLMRNGALFVRMNELEQEQEIIQPPTYRGEW